MRRGSWGLIGLALVGCGHRLAPPSFAPPSAVPIQGTWDAVVVGAPKSPAEFLWKNCKLDFDRRGRFHAYSRIYSSGFADVSDRHVDLKVLRLLGAGIEDWRNASIPFTILAGLQLDAPISLELKNDRLVTHSTCPAYDGIEFKRRPPDTARDLVHLFNSRILGESTYGYDHLLDQGDAAVPELLQVFEDPKEHDYRAMVGSILGHSKLPAAQDALVKGLSDEWMPVRYLCCDALGRAKAVDRIPDIAKAVDDKRVAVFEAARAFRAMEDPKAVPYLVKMLDIPEEGKVKTGFQTADVIRALGACREPKVIPTILKYRSSSYSRVQEAVETAFVSLDPSRVDRKTTTPKLIALLDDPDWTVREDALSALGRLGDPAAIAAVTKCLMHSNSATRAAAIEALVSLRAPDVRNTAIRMTADPQPVVRETAERALRKIGPG